MGNNGFFDSPQRRTRIVIIAAGLVVLVGLSLGAGYAINNLSGNNTSGPDDSDSATNSSIPPEETSLTIIDGEDTVDGVSVGYPHSKIGAVSAAVEYTAQFGSTLDSDRAEDIAEVAMDSDSVEASEARKFTEMMRKQAGLPPDGPVPDGASAVMSPVAYQLRDESDDRMTVLLLCSTSTTSAGGAEKEGHIPMSMPMAWIDGDWKGTVADTSDIDHDALKATPGSDDAHAKGWMEITR